MSVEIKPFETLFKEKYRCDKCDAYDVPVEEANDLAECGCCWDYFNYCKECYFKWLYCEYITQNEKIESYNEIYRELKSKNKKLENEIKAYNKTFKELSNGKL